jgi:hypothetical protein
MAKNTDQNEGSKFRTIENDGFGASKTKKISVGDLVEWDSWEYNLQEEVFCSKQGLLTEIIRDKRLTGWAYVAKILPFGEDKEVFIPMISIRKMKGTY